MSLPRTLDSAPLTSFVVVCPVQALLDGDRTMPVSKKQFLFVVRVLLSFAASFTAPRLPTALFCVLRLCGIRAFWSLCCRPSAR